MLIAEGHQAEAARISNKHLGSHGPGRRLSSAFCNQNREQPLWAEAGNVRPQLPTSIPVRARPFRIFSVFGRGRIVPKTISY
jgi:hypothetical protein